MIRRILALSLIASLTGCATSATYAPSTATNVYAPRTSPDKIEMFRSQMPTKKFVEIGSVSHCCGDSVSSLEKLKEKASEAGGDAIIGIEIDATGVTSASVIRYN